MLDCVKWTIRNDYGGHHDRRSAATTVEDCRTECNNNRNCMAIDWVTWESTGSQCWLVGRWTSRSEYRRGMHRHTINRACGQHCYCSLHLVELNIALVFPRLAVGLEY